MQIYFVYAILLNMEKTPIEKVVYDHFGGPLNTARVMTARRVKTANGKKITEVSRQNVYYWINVSCPPDVAKALELESEGYVTRAQLCPEIFL